MTEKIPDKHRRARAILLNMVKDGYLRKEGAARSTIYVKNTEGRSAVHLCRIVVHGVHTGESTGQDQDLKGHNDPDGVKAQHEHFRPVGSVDEIHGATAEKLDQ